MKPIRLPIIVAAAFLVSASAQAQKVTYEEHVLPILRNSCLKCHNPDKSKADLDLSTFSGALKGSNNGPVLVGGDPDSSKMVKAITHAEDPTMPPNGKLPDGDVATIKKWIAGGLLENSGSKAIVSNKPKVDLSAVAVTGKPSGPPPMPADSLLEPVVHTARTSVSTALANSPWAPLVALGGQRQVLLYNTDTLELANVLPFPEGFPCDIKFSRSGKLLLAAGGRGSKSGLAVVWDVTTGERILSVGDELDSVLAADISADQKWIALGGPTRLVKIFSTKTGEMVHKIKKHTDWVTAMEFSPDSKLLATGDRNGGLVVWEADSGEEFYTLTGHKAAITSVTWRSPGILVSASEDGSVRMWGMDEGQQVKNWIAHESGVLGMKSASDGRIVTCSRGKHVKIWSAGGDQQREMDFDQDIVVRCAFSHDGNRVIAVDWLGNVRVWNTADGVKVGELSLNPPDLSTQQANAAKRVEELQKAIEQSPASVTAAEAELAKAKADLAAAKKGADLKPLNKNVSAAEEKLAQAKAAAARAPKDLAVAKSAVERLKLAASYTVVYHAREDLGKKKADQEKAAAETTAAEAAVKKATGDLAAAQKATPKDAKEKTALTKRIKTLTDQIKDETAKASTSKKTADKLAKELATEKPRVEKLIADYQRLKGSPAPAQKTAKL